MAKLVLLIALFVLPAIAVAARPTKNPLVVRGKVYCDKCQAGFETSAITYIAGAKVRLECRNRKTNDLLYKKDCTTDSSGTYTAYVSEDHGTEQCDAMLVSSPLPDCSTPSSGRDRARIVLTRNNGISTDDRFANNMGFMINKPLTECTQILEQYKLDDEES